MMICSGVEEDAAVEALFILLLLDDGPQHLCLIPCWIGHQRMIGQNHIAWWPGDDIPMLFDPDLQSRIDDLQFVVWPNVNDRGDGPSWKQRAHDASLALHRTLNGQANL